MSWILSIIALVVALSLRGRVKYLEETVKKLSGGEALLNNTAPTPITVPSASGGFPQASQQTIPDAVSASQAADAQIQPAPALSQAPAYVDPITAFFRWFAIDWPMKLGAILLFLALVWVVTVVFWDAIGPVGQVTLGFLIGIAILFFGAKRIEGYANQGSVLLALGAGIVYVTIFASRTQYDFFNPAIALLFMFLVTVFVAYVSVVQKNFSLALLGLFLGGIAPLLTASPEPSVFGLFSYLFILTLGTLWVVRLTGWRKLTIASMVLYVLYVIPLLMTSHPTDADQWMKMLTAIAFALLFFGASLLSVIHDRKSETGDLVVSLANGLILLGWINTIIPPEWQSFMAVLTALVATIGAFMVYSFSGLREPVYIHSAVAGVFFGMATAYELSGSTLVIAYILEVTALVLGAQFMLRSEAAARKAALVSALPVILSVESIWNYAMATEVFTKDFFALFLLVLMFSIFAFIFRKKEGSAVENIGHGAFFSVVGALYALVLIWLASHNIFSNDQATLFSLFIYTVVGMTLYIKGKVAAEKDMRAFGAFLLILVTGHLLLVDIWGMDVLGRIATFTIIGLLFMSTAFIGREKI